MLRGEKRFHEKSSENTANSIYPLESHYEYYHVSNSQILQKINGFHIINPTYTNIFSTILYIYMFMSVILITTMAITIY